MTGFAARRAAKRRAAVSARPTYEQRHQWETFLEAVTGHVAEMRLWRDTHSDLRGGAPYASRLLALRKRVNSLAYPAGSAAKDSALNCLLQAVDRYLGLEPNERAGELQLLASLAQQTTLEMAPGERRSRADVDG